MNLNNQWEAFVSKLPKITLHFQFALWLVIILISGGCAASHVETSGPSPESPTETAVPPTDTLQPAATWTARPTITPTPRVQLCSPLQDIPLAQIPEQIKNPYHPPPMGSDDHHQAIDIADLDPTYGYAVEGRPVQAVLSGRVAGVTANRFPYGSLLIIETFLDGIPPEWQGQLQLPAPAPTPSVKPALTCPNTAPLPEWISEKRSLYLLYAHLKTPPAFQNGDPITCGQVIGAVGGSGNALNPHLHLEARLGPAGTQFGEMAHYDPAASAAEMDAYCLWRVSGWFQVLDPLTILLLNP